MIFSCWHWSLPPAETSCSGTETTPRSPHVTLVANLIGTLHAEPVFLAEQLDGRDARQRPAALASFGCHASIPSVKRGDLAAIHIIATAAATRTSAHPTATIVATAIAFPANTAATIAPAPRYVRARRY